MRQFINGSNNDYFVLENKVQGKCIRFNSQELPASCTPNTGHIGFEVEEPTNSATLWISSNISYAGSNQEISQWFIDGKKTFLSFDQLKKWIQTEIRAEFDCGNPDQGKDSTSNNEHQTANEITDMEIIHNNLPNEQEAIYLDEVKLLHDLKEKVKGQNTALENLSKSIARHCARKKPTRPAVLFAVGPTGVGKTRTAELIREVISNQNGDINYNFLRLDMTEYQEAHRVSQLIGAPQGYIGHGEGSQLVDAFRANKRTIVLFDEIEKAHPSILKVLMNAMDAGRISSPQREGNDHNVDCRYAIFIFTSNLDASGIISELESCTGDNLAYKVDEVCRHSLRASGIAPEIVGRISRFLVYFPLGQKERAEIMTLSIAEIVQEYGLSLEYVAPEVVISFMQMMRANDFGARPAKYFIDEEIGSLCVSAAQQGHKKIKILGPPLRFEASLLPD